MTRESGKGKSDSRPKENKKDKGCYWSWLEDAEIKTYQAWNNVGTKSS